MELEKQVCSLALAKRLKELGVKQESYFYWMDTTTGNWHQGNSLTLNETGQILDQQPASSFLMPRDMMHNNDAVISAFTVAELGEMLYSHELPHSMAGTGNWETSEYYDFEDGRKRVKEVTEADARAKMLIYLLENKLITL